jgi:hypothetical protein
MMQEGPVEEGASDTKRSPVTALVRVREQEASLAHADAHAPEPLVLGGQDRVECSKAR